MSSICLDDDILRCLLWVFAFYGQSVCRFNYLKKDVLLYFFIFFKGTVRPDWICMRVVPLESPLKGHQPLYVFDFLISVLNIWNNFKVLSRFMQNWIQSPACSVHGLHRMLSSYWLAHFHLMKKSAKVQLYFSSVCGMMKFLPASRNPKNNWCLSRCSAQVGQNRVTPQLV